MSLVCSEMNFWNDIICVVHVAMFPGLPAIQFLIAYSMQKQRRKAWSILWHELHQCLPRQTEGVGVPDRKNPFCTCSLFRTSGKFSLYEHLELQYLDRYYKDKLLACSFGLEPLSPFVHLGRHWRNSHDKKGPDHLPLFLYTLYIKLTKLYMRTLFFCELGVSDSSSGNAKN